MPWKCPACHTAINHSEVEARPRLDALYRCPVCRLELVFDRTTEKMTVAPMRDDAADKKDRIRR